MGARAHGLIRSATVYVDGPLASGLLYECVKNLALSGVGRLVIVISEEKHDENYHWAELDDLAKTYMRGARSELGLPPQTNDHVQLLVEFLQRLNPSLTVETISRETILLGGGLDTGILLCVDRPYSTQVRLNNKCRQCGLSFVAAETAGVYGRAFSDFGATFHVHDMDGETPLVVPLDRVEVLTEDENTPGMLIRSIEGERHDVSKGDVIQFHLTNGDVMDIPCLVAKVKSPHEVIVVPDESSFSGSLEDLTKRINVGASSFSRTKQITEVQFLPLEEATGVAESDPSLFTPCDLGKSFDDIRRRAITSCFQSMGSYSAQHEKLPSTLEERELFVDTTTALVPADQNVGEAFKSHCKNFSDCCNAKYVPIQAIFGAIACQECLKAASGLYNPIRQFLLYDCDEVITSLERDCNENDAVSGQAYIFGSDIDNILRNQKLFVVGAGAIGCEILKNLSAMSAGTGQSGSIVLTDMDTIERSNLSRQLLFRDGDIGKFKSKAAQEAVSRLNPDVKLDCHTSKVGDNESGPFDSQFWSDGVDIVLNALDNMEARLFIDSQCVANVKALVDAGTLGSKGNVQVVVPHQSESYGSSADPPEQAIPVCTLKNFPYAISHTIQWGRDMFDGLFVRRPEQANKYSKMLETGNISELLERLEHDLGDEAVVDAARELSEDLQVLGNKLSGAQLREECIRWAASLAKNLFSDSIEKLLTQHPVDSVDEDGELFWSGSRKVPKALVYEDDNSDATSDVQNIVNDNLVSFVQTASRLRMETCFGVGSGDGRYFVAVDKAKEALREGARQGATLETDISLHDQALLLLQSVESDNLSYCEKLSVADFEKDDDSNGHIAFITAASNLRAMCYGIPPVDEMETRRVAGSIVPAMITTTAFVSALSCIELTKLVQGVPLTRHRNAFINLALPFFAFTAPLPADEVAGLRGQSYTLWDRLIIRESELAPDSRVLTLRDFLEAVKAKSCDEPESIDISSVNFGQYMVYANLLHEDDQELLEKSLVEVVEDAVKSGNAFDAEFSRDESSSVGGSFSSDLTLELSVAVEDLETGEEIELPPVRVIRSDDLQ